MPSGDVDGADLGLLSPGWAGRPIARATSDAAVLAALVLFESALAEITAPAGVADRIASAARGIDIAELAASARAGGNPVIPLLDMLRRNLSPDDAAWLHRGATSQDALDTALVLMTREAATLIADDAAATARALAAHAAAHRDTVMVGRTLTQVSTPITVGLKIGGWAWSVARAASGLRRATGAVPLQLGGASGTLASFTAAGHDGLDVTARLAANLRLPLAVAPWHVHRSPITRVGDALVELSDALGTVGANIALLARTEFGELDDGAAGGSSAMPHKSNPVRAVLLNAAARQAPLLAAQLHLDASTVDERPDGAWHAEWQTLRTLLRTVGGAAATGRELADGLRIHPEAIAAHVAASASDLLSESARYSAEPITDPAGYLGESGRLTDRLLAAVEDELSDRGDRA